MRVADAAAGSPLPPDLAGGPDPAVWALDVSVPHWLDDAEGRRLSAEAAAVQAWNAAGERWGAERGLPRGGWRGLLPADVAEAVSARGRAARRAGALVAPWER